MIVQQGTSSWTVTNGLLFKKKTITAVFNFYIKSLQGILRCYKIIHSLWHCCRLLSVQNWADYAVILNNYHWCLRAASEMFVVLDQSVSWNSELVFASTRCFAWVYYVLCRVVWNYRKALGWTVLRRQHRDEPCCVDITVSKPLLP